MSRERGTVSWVDLQALDPRGRREIWEFVARYEDLPFEEFDRLCADLPKALLGRYAGGAIGAFGAARIITVGSGPDERTVVWGEWGFFEPTFRGRLMLERGMLSGAIPSLLRHPLRPVYFLAEAATWKGYLALSRGLVHLWPRPDKPVPEAERAIVAQVLARRADPDWDPGLGVFHRRKRVSPESDAERTPEHLRSLQEFYRSANPGYARGDTLLCVGRATWPALMMMPLRALWAQLSASVRPRPGTARCVS